MRMFHGSTRGFTAHIGVCLTDDQAAAWDYAVRGIKPGQLVTVDLQLHGLRVEKGRPFEDGADACGDSAAEVKRLRRRGVDVVEFTDQSPGGRQHRTWRLISRKALRAVSPNGMNCVLT